MVVGCLIGVIGLAVSTNVLRTVTGIVASVMILAGGVVIAVSFRAELGHTPSTSRLAFLASRASLKYVKPQTAGSGKGSGSSSVPAEVQAYAGSFSAALDRCDMALARAGRGADLDVEIAREQLMRLVADSRYGKALAVGLISEERIQSTTRQLAARGEGRAPGHVDGAPS